MKTKCLIKCFLFMCIIVLACGTVSSAEDITIKGRIQILSIDSDDTITGVYVENQDERFIVMDNINGRKLFKMIGTDVSVTGTVTVDGEKNKIINVKHFENTDDLKNENMDEKE